MGSRMMHLIISDKVYGQLQLQDEAAFLLGGIAPDAAFTHERKNESHFFEGSLDDGTRFLNYIQFTQKYRQEIKNEYFLGYLSHLISDDVWMKFIYFKHDFKTRLDLDPTLLQRWHRDFRHLNGRLVKKFNCEHLRNKLSDAYSVFQISEISFSDLLLLKSETLQDFIFTDDDLLKELQVYNFDEIVEYIELSVEKAVKICRSVLSQ